MGQVSVFLLNKTDILRITAAQNYSENKRIQLLGKIHGKK